MPFVTLCCSLSLHPSPVGTKLHTAGYRALSLPFAYVPFAVRDLKAAIAGVRALGIRGAGVSYPYKQEVMGLLDAVDPLAASIGAVNTVVNDEGKLTGHNTDWVGAVRALEEVVTLASARVLLLGAGGAGRAIAYGLRQRGAELTIANRDVAKAEELGRAVGAEARGFAEVERASDYDVLVNATVVGMTDVDPRSPVPEHAIVPGHLVMDIVFKPFETTLLASARRRGARVVHGGRMVLHQAARQFELYTGHTAPLEAMEAALAEALTPAANKASPARG
jgi:shikimate dehydrogenase